MIRKFSLIRKTAEDRMDGLMTVISGLPFWKGRLVAADPILIASRDRLWLRPRKGRPLSFY